MDSSGAGLPSASRRTVIRRVVAYGTVLAVALIVVSAIWGLRQYRGSRRRTPAQ